MWRVVVPGEIEENGVGGIRRERSIFCGGSDACSGKGSVLVGSPGVHRCCWSL